MKVIVQIVAVILTIQIIDALPTGCPPTWVAGQEVYFPHEDCTKFYQCVHGKPQEMPCAPGTEWNDARKECDWPHLAGCSSHPTTTHPTTKVPTTSHPTTSHPTSTASPVTTSKPPHSKCPFPWVEGEEVYFPHKDCTKFYQCVHGKPQEMPCAPGTEWNDAEKRCDWPHLAGCSSHPTTNAPTTGRPTTARPTTARPTTTGRPTTSHPTSAAPTTASPITTSKPPHSKCPFPWVEGEEVYFPHKDCTKFYQCVHGKPQEMPCAPGTEWNDAEKRCDWPHLAGCSSHPTTNAPTTGRPTTARPTTARPTTTGRPTTSHPTSAAPTTASPITTSKPPHSKCPFPWVEGEEVYFPHKDCTKFYQCVHGKPQEMPCAPGTEWNDSEKRCDWPHLAGCSSHPTTNAPTTGRPTTARPTTARPTTTGRPTTSHPTSAAPTTASPITTSKPPHSKCPFPWVEGEEVYFPHKDCTKFYQCVHGKPQEMPCAPGTEWNDAEKRCDWPHLAGCSSHPTTNAPTTGRPTTARPTTARPTTTGRPTTSHPTSAAPTTASPITTSKPPHSKCPFPWVEGEEVYFPHKDCTKFYQCVHGKPQEMPCAPGTEWNDAEKRCDWPHLAGCSSHPTTSGPTTNDPITTARPTTARPTTARPTTARPTTARPTTARPTTARPTTARPTTARPTTARPTTAKPNACPATGCPPVWTPGVEVYLKHPDCKKFCHCVHGSPVEMPCAPGTEWNDATKLCDFPHLAKCSA